MHEITITELFFLFSLLFWFVWLVEPIQEVSQDLLFYIFKFEIQILIVSVTKSYPTMVWARWPWKKECSQYQNQEQYIWLQVICSGGCTKHWESWDLLITLQFTKNTFPNCSMVSTGKQIQASVPVPLLGNSTHKLNPEQSSSHFQCAKGAKCQGHQNPSLNQQPVPPSLSLRPA